MSIRNLIATFTLAAAALAPFPASGAESQHRAACALAAYNVTQVAPYRVQKRVGRGVYHRVVGAKLFVPAAPGLTREWIGANMMRHLEQMRVGSMPGCPLDLDDVRVSVTSAGTGYWVQVSSDDRETANEILKRAQHLVH